MSENSLTDEQNESSQDNGQLPTVQGMYKDYFLDYASYVILERAVPAIEDGLKPVQRRILHAMFEMDDGRYNKVANLIGSTMQFHPHGDAAIGDALVNMGQKDLLIDTQGNWGNIYTGDRAAASRYIEARLSKFALTVAFNPRITEWQLSYDGRKREPVALPMKFPMLLALGAEGIAVGLSTRIMPHNFIELIKASIKQLQGKRVKIFPDFRTGGLIDVTDYQGGKRGGRIKVRARIELEGKNQLIIRELPYGVTTSSLIDSILKANDKGKIKIKRVSDNTSKDVEVVVELASGISPEVTMDALYAFTHCQVSISPNACVIIDDKPHFLTVEELLRISTERTRDLLKAELELRRNDLEEKLHFASLEKIFIGKRIYRDIEESETWEDVLTTINSGLRKYVRVPGEPTKRADKRIVLLRDITEEDLVRLTEIKIKRISKYNTFKADEAIAKMEDELNQVKHNLDNLTDFAIAYFEELLKKFGKGRERRTEITTFEKVEAVQVVANNAKLYVNRKEGFFGTGLKKEEFVCDCSDIDDVIVFLKNGSLQVSKIADKVFVGKDITHIDIWRRGDERTTYNMAYLEGKSGRTYVKRFNVKAITRDRNYSLVGKDKKSRVYYFSANPNGEAEIISVQLTQGSRARKKVFEFDFAELDIKGRGSKGNTLTTYPVRKITLKEVGLSTLGALEVYMDKVSGRLNTDKRGEHLGNFDTGDQILAIYKEGTYEIIDLDMNKRFDPTELMHIGLFDPVGVVSAVYYDGEKGWTMVKRFQIETVTTGERFSFLTDHRNTKLLYATLNDEPRIIYKMRVKNQTMEAELDLCDFIDIKGWKAKGNKLSEYKLTSVKPAPQENTLKPGDRVEFTVDKEKQGELF